MGQDSNFEQFETILVEVLDAAKSKMSDEDISTVQEFIDVGEYGLAYERLWDTMPTGEGEDLRNKLRIVGAMMGYDDSGQST